MILMLGRQTQIDYLVVLQRKRYEYVIYSIRTMSSRQVPRPTTRPLSWGVRVGQNFPLKLQKCFFLLKVEWHIYIVLVVHMQLGKDGPHHTPVEPALSHILQTSGETVGQWTADNAQVVITSHKLPVSREL